MVLRTSQPESGAVGNKMDDKIRRNMGTRCDNGGCKMNREKDNNYKFHSFFIKNIVADNTLPYKRTSFKHSHFHITRPAKRKSLKINKSSSNHIHQEIDIKFDRHRRHIKDLNSITPG